MRTKCLARYFSFLLVAILFGCVSATTTSAQDTLQTNLESQSELLVDSAPIAGGYLEYVRSSLAALRGQIPHISSIADSSAEKLVRSEDLFRVRSHVGFASELSGRAGGLGITSRQKIRDTHPDAVTLLAIAENTTMKFNRIGDIAVSKGYRVLFTAPEHVPNASRQSRRKFRANYFSAVIDNFTGSRPGFAFGQNEIASSSLMNIANGWIYTAELTASFTRIGYMPVVYLSFALDSPNDYARVARYSVKPVPEIGYGLQQAFHDDVIISDTRVASKDTMVVAPIEKGVLADSYISILDGYLSDYLTTRADHLTQIIDRATAVKKAGNDLFFFAIGHTFPDEVPTKQRTRGVMHILPQNWPSDRYSGKQPGPNDLVLLFGMPTYPSRRAEYAEANGLNLVVLSTEAPTGREAGSVSSERFLWLQTPWPLEDGAVDIPGYDIDILPVTGFMNVALFYAIALELYTRTSG